MAKKRTGEPWITAADYGRLLPPFCVNLIVRDIERSLAFYREVLEAFVHYSDVDFAALRVSGVEVMLHADHTYDGHPLYTRLTGDAPRGDGVELRLLGIDPDGAEERARAGGWQVVAPASTKGHGWSDAMLEDPDGYVWAVGVLTADE